MPTQDRTIAENTLLAKLHKAAKTKNLARFSKESFNWFQKQVNLIGNKKAWAILLADTAAKDNVKPASEVVPGKIYAYMYLAKWREKLPYWDAFPLIVMVGPAKKGFYGLNLHYLPPKYRAILMDKLIQITNNKRYDKTTKIMLSYELLMATEKLSEFKPCFKHYLYSQLQTDVLEIAPSRWESVIFLPFQKFMKQSTNKVWDDSKKKI